MGTEGNNSVDLCLMGVDFSKFVGMIVDSFTTLSRNIGLLKNKFVKLPVVGSHGASEVMNTWE